MTLKTKSSKLSVTKVIVRVPSGKPAKYEVVVGGGAVAATGVFIRDNIAAERATVVTNADIWNIHGPKLAKSLKAAGLKFDLIEIPEGEAFKTTGTLNAIYEALVDINARRQEPIVGFGGGVVGDIAGFAAATYMRGIPFVNVPTTLLAMADSSVGGKTAVDLPDGKNLIGAFYQPSAVFTDTEFLETLPDREYQCGLAEILKMAVLDGEAALSFIEKMTEPLRRKDQDALIRVLARAIGFKAAVIEKDALDTQGVRETLNLGHTLGHALETAASYESLNHGEAVAIGLVFALRLSLKLDICEENVFIRITDILEKTGLPVKPSAIDMDEIVEIMQKDKKNKGKGLTFVLLEDIGRPVVKTINDKTVRTCLEETADG